MNDPAHRLETIDQLQALYRAPNERVKAKKTSVIDPAAAAIISTTPFFLVATADAAGNCDVSPRGGPSGQLRILDDSTVAFPDLSGNNLIDTLRNIIDNPHCGLLILTPGTDETLRLNGRAHISTDPELLARWDELVRRPKCAVVIELDDMFLHCAKAFRRGEVWQPESWAKYASLPDHAESFLAATGMSADIADVRAGLEASYADDLANERPI
ncbi:MAG: pyridoxamine 5'-phosphate oxidase family protein [Acidimicrobiales bacterium]